MRKYIAFTLVVATLALVGCGSSQDSETTTGLDSLTTGQPTSSIDLSVTTTTVSSTADMTTIPTTAVSQTGSPQGTAPVTTVAPKAPTATTTPKAPTATQVPQMKLTGTPQEQVNQVVAATENVAEISNFKKWSVALHQLNLSLVSYGVEVVWDPNGVGSNVYQISLGDQRACFLWTEVNPNVSDEMYLEPHSCA